MRVCLVLAALTHLLLLVFYLDEQDRQPEPTPVLDIVLQPLPKLQAADSQSLGKSAVVERATTLAISNHHEPIKRTVDANSTDPKDLAYLARWQAHIEAKGADLLTQPDKALLKGQLSMMVTVNRDGTLSHVALTHSSGNPVLDKTALQIVKGAAPFEPFPSELASELDALEIVRTWHFHGPNIENS